MTTVIPIVALTSAAFMSGVLWLVQIVHYPLLGEVSDAAIREISSRHQKLITRVVGPIMVIEAVSSLFVLVLHPNQGLYLVFAAMALLVVAILVTMLQAIPLHSQIAKGNSHLIPRLIRINWARTTAWSLRIPLGILIVHKAFP